MSNTIKKPVDAPVFKWASGETYVCIKSASPGYREGSRYTAYKNDKGIVCLLGNDGFEDYCSMLCSAFKLDTPKDHGLVSV